MPASSAGGRVEEPEPDRGAGQGEQPVQHVGALLVVPPQVEQVAPLVAPPSRRKPSRHESVRSTTHRYRPNRTLDAVPRLVGDQGLVYYALDNAMLAGFCSAL